jgi:hypothetical protein
MNLLPVITDVTYTASDETFYVGNFRSGLTDHYNAKTMEELEQLLTQDGWSSIGTLGRGIRFENRAVQVSAWQRNDKYIAAWLEIDGLFDVIRLREYAMMSKKSLLGQMPTMFSVVEERWRGNMMRLRPETWYEVGNQLSDDEIKHLIRFFTVAERDLPSWKSGSVSPVIWLTHFLQRRRTELDLELVEWIRKTSTNPYLPYGTFN